MSSHIYRLPPEETAGTAWNMSHFPARFQFVIFRNWNRVPVERLAGVLETSPEQILLEAARMGLRRYDPDMCRVWETRGYLTVIRQNWNILNYEQLMRLLNVGSDRLYRILMDEDFMFHKLGRQKPFCPPVKFRPLSKDELAATERLGAAVRPLTADGGGEREFAFLEALETPSGPAPCAAPESRRGELRMVYSYCAPFGDILLPGAPDPFPDGLLAQYQASGINAVWLPLLLSDLTPWTGDPDYSAKWEVRQDSLHRITEKLARYGIRLFGYLNEPRALPAEIAARHPDWLGPAHHDGSGMRALCLGNPEVVAALRKGMEMLCRAVPGMGGFFTISMSENLTHCHSHRNASACPRCSLLPDPSSNIITLHRTLWEGIQAAGSSARLIAWNWGWQQPWDLKILDALPREVELMCVSETDLETDCHGIRGRIVDYSLAHPGPGPLALRLWEYARKQGRRIIAKIQLNATWELSTLPYVPVPQLAKRHLDNLASLGVRDFMLAWTLGGAPGGNLPLTDLTVRQWCERISSEYAAEIEQACRYFSAGFAQFPFDGVSLIYKGPQNFGCGNLLYREPSGRAATMVGFCYDDVYAWSGKGHYPPEVLEKTFDDMAETWVRGYELLHDIAGKISGNAAFEELFNMAEAGYCILRSSADQIAYYNCRDREDDPGKLRALAKRESETALRLLRTQRRDSRLGFEAGNHYLYGENELLEKYLNCNDLGGSDH